MRALGNFVADRAVLVGSAKSLVTADQGGTFLLDTATGSTATLPASVGDGGKYNFLVITLPNATATHIVKVANTGDILQGFISASRNDATGNTVTFVAGATHDTITLNAGTTGGVVKGEWIEVVDATSGTFVVCGHVVVPSTATAATSFSASV